MVVQGKVYLKVRWEGKLLNAENGAEHLKIGIFKIINYGKTWGWVPSEVLFLGELYLFLLTNIYWQFYLFFYRQSA